MNARLTVAWAVLAISMLVGACSSSSKKVLPTPSDAGAAGEAPEESAGTGGGGAPGSDDAGAAGEVGLSPVTLAALAGEWSGTITPTYVCESSPAPLEITIEGATLTTTGWPGQTITSATIQQQVGQAFTVAFEIAETPYTPAGTAYGQLYVDPSAQYALLVAQELDSNGNSNSNGYIALLERGTRNAGELADEDIVGDWTGATVRVDADYAVTDTFESTATFSSVSGGEGVSSILLLGEDADGKFSSESVARSEGSIWASTGVSQDAALYGALLFMSSDKQVLLGALLQDTDEDGNSALCDQDIFFDMPDHKFALWKRVAR